MFYSNETVLGKRDYNNMVLHIDLIVFSVQEIKDIAPQAMLRE